MASDWVEKYQEDPYPAMGELIQFFFNFSGCTEQLNSESFDDIDAAITTEELALPENFPEVHMFVCTYVCMYICTSYVRVYCTYVCTCDLYVCTGYVRMYMCIFLLEGVNPYY